MGGKLLGLVIALSGCFSPSAPSGAPCTPDGTCPIGLQCLAGLCVSEASADATSPTDADAGPDSAVDASLDAEGIADAAVDAAPSPARWSDGPDLPQPRALSCAVTLDGFLFSIGGSASGVLQREVYRSAIDGAALAPWIEVEPLPVALRWHSCAVHPATRAIFVIGGQPTPNGTSQLVYRGQVGSTGDVTWDDEVSLPAPRRGASAVVIADVLFVLGGEEADGFVLRRTVYAATIGAAGLSPFSVQTPLPSEDYVMGAATSGSTIYLTGGFNGGTAVRSTTVTGVSAAPFTSLAPLLERRERHVAAALDQHLYVTGGEGEFNGTNLFTTQRAALNTDGTIGPWQAQPDLPENLAYAAGASGPKHIYVLGGSTGNNASASVYIFTPEVP